MGISDWSSDVCSSDLLLVVRPEAANSNDAACMILPGTSGTPEAQANLTSIGNAVVAHGFWAVLPQALDNEWNDNPGYSTGVDDVGFNAKIIDILTGYLHLDADRIFASGLSDGAFMAERLGCELSEIGRASGRERVCEYV